ncbi:MAG TPA: hypothetical protein EYQ09_05680 [Flavobacteriales bacterium]|nr:hypothetical protein [Flavobacteriales bacterium]HIK62950.1 hypothetical protein [Flavobacteriales bacterium]
MKRIFLLIFMCSFLSFCSEKTTYKCTICEMSFEEKDRSDKCQDWCENHHSCNVEIISHSIK